MGKLGLIGAQRRKSLRPCFFCCTFAPASRITAHKWYMICAKYVQKNGVRAKKITIYLRMSNNCCNFAPSSQRRRGQSPSVARRLHIFYTNNTNWIRRNLANFQESQRLAIVSAFVVYYFCCICDSGNAKVTLINTMRVFFCACTCANNIYYGGSRKADKE